ncbi:hypothetical protein P153DRAFT_113098 [Dothidotthia symphoricarpi CBS 119687]|uniref:Uncharacterized protein n=1 Tax=Dothidotthia symphoricarpi CBS 119687 TaxID=1392245 RepID=A0A6A6A2N5_9PLEO|nr:uncharacterized protein P153DRAFT_113098 [Dothidotthia symphoricarpi CBS 119687]KAF2125443.1 hypothetical protein P153DRAFT_113098 [Dothidotthia symphoricarpi CBS 119687]
MFKIRVRTPSPVSRLASPSSPDQDFPTQTGCRPDWTLPSDVVLENHFQPKFIALLRASTFDRTGKCFCALVIATANDLLSTDLTTRFPTSVRDFFTVLHAFCSSPGIHAFLRSFTRYDNMQGHLGAHAVYITQWTFARWLQSFSEQCVDPEPQQARHNSPEAADLPRIRPWERFKYAVRHILNDKQGRLWVERLYREEHGRPRIMSVYKTEDGTSRLDSVIQRGLSLADPGGKRRWSARWREAHPSAAGGGGADADADAQGSVRDIVEA